MIARVAALVLALAALLGAPGGAFATNGDSATRRSPAVDRSDGRCPGGGCHGHHRGGGGHWWDRDQGWDWDGGGGGDDDGCCGRDDGDWWDEEGGWGQAWRDDDDLPFTGPPADFWGKLATAGGFVLVGAILWWYGWIWPRGEYPR